MPWMDYFERFLQHDRLATGRLINLLESGEDQASVRQVIRACAAQKKEAYVVGITGVPGAGKSTLIDQLGCWLLDQGYTVGVICVDPSSPFRGGAILGDRVRFQNLRGRQGCFVRSMATRGHMGGLGVATRDVIQLLEAGGYDVVIVETVGTGQTEVEIVSSADTVVLMSVPGLGDQMQMVKAGIMEIGDVFVVNQSDRPGGEEAVSRLRNNVQMFGNDKGDWRPPVLATVATKGEGVPELGGEILRRRDFLLEKGEKKKLRVKRDVEASSKLVEHRFAASLKEFTRNSERGRAIREDLESGDIDVYEASEQIWGEIINSCSE